jgi:hypothetical protein
MAEKRSGLHIYQSRYVEYSNPCHNPAGPGGGQFCGGSGGGENSNESGWKPSMTLAEAKKWAKNSDYKEPLFHGTSASGVENISSSGFDGSKMGSFTQGAMYGTGFYFTANKTFATRYAREGTRPLKIMVNSEKTCHFPEFTKLMKENKAALDKATMSDDMTARARLMTKIIKGAGYDALSLQYPKEYGGHHEFIVYDKTKIVVIK